MPDPGITSKSQLLRICDHFIKHSKDTSAVNHEVEIRFGTKGKRITRVDYDNVVKKLLSMEYTSSNMAGSHTLKISENYVEGDDKPRWAKKNIRVNISNLSDIQVYCKTNELKPLANSRGVQFEQKANVYEDDAAIPYAEFTDFSFRVAYNTERTANESLKAQVVDSWGSLSKSFRYINRVSFTKADSPFRVDMSITQMSHRDDKSNLMTGVFSGLVLYEVEVELMNNIARKMFSRADAMSTSVLTIAKELLGGLQKTAYPVSYPEQQSVAYEYVKLIGAELPDNKMIESRMFIGPSSVTLHIENILQISSATELSVPNIRTNYVVTEKADGERRMLFVNKVGKIYFITSKMDIIFTGAKTVNEKLFGTLLDGEYISHDRTGNFIQTYAVFDAYFVGKTDIRARKFVNGPPKSNGPVVSGRFAVSKDVVDNLKPVFVGKGNTSLVKIVLKKFYPSPLTVVEPTASASATATAAATTTIFKACAHILKQQKERYFAYNIDGLIFTPSDLGVGSRTVGSAGPLYKVTWAESFKWKPAEFNTVDFLVTTVQKDGADHVTTRVNAEIASSHSGELHQYKTLILRCGYNVKRDGQLNPCEALLNDDFEKSSGADYHSSKNIPAQFYPTRPYDKNGGITNVRLTTTPSGQYSMVTEEGDTFESNTIVECRYDMTREVGMRWIPLRVRYDKPVDIRSSRPEFGNAYSTANSNWHSIHYPVTEQMITTGKNITDMSLSDVYYNGDASLGKTASSNTDRMRTFHNIFVKKTLILGVSGEGETLIDYACGKGGDLKKWIDAKLSFVFGIDISGDNLKHKMNGACARYIGSKKTYAKMPDALFVNGDSGKHIRSGKFLMEGEDNGMDDKITKMVFGTIGKTHEPVPSAVMRQYGVGADGFDVSSCQFAIHYMFKNADTFHTFMRNVSECTKVGGYFIGTTYDGRTIFDKLRSRKMGDGEALYSADTVKVWEIIKKYEDTEFPNTEQSLGKAITVYQDSINQYIDEYLVNFEFLKGAAKEYGFEELTAAELANLNTPIKFGSGMFGDLYTIMLDEKSGENDNMKMTATELAISGLNRYFIFKKHRRVDADKIAAAHISKHSVDMQMNAPPLKKKKNPSVRKTGRRIVITKKMEDDALTMVAEDDDAVVVDDDVAGFARAKQVAIIIPFRDSDDGVRGEQFVEFEKHMRKFFAGQKGTDFSVYVIVQSADGRKFNRGALLNAGYILALERKPDTDLFIFHDVDLLPNKLLRPQYTHIPEKGAVHIARAWKGRYGDDSDNRYFGGIVAFGRTAYEKINGFPNTFWGWGGEDDALRARMDIVGIPVERGVPIPATKNQEMIKDLEDLSLADKMSLLKKNPEMKEQFKREKVADDKTNWGRDGINSIVVKVMDDTDGAGIKTTDENFVIQVVDVMPDEQSEETQLDFIAEYPTHYDSVAQCKKYNDGRTKFDKLPEKTITNVHVLVEKIKDMGEVRGDGGPSATSVGVFEKYHNITNKSIQNTAKYLFDKIRMGVFISIRNNYVEHFIPFYNNDFSNEWSDKIEFKGRDGDPTSNISDFIYEKDKFEKENAKGLGKKHHKQRSVGDDIQKDVGRWAANNCLLGTWTGEKIGDLGWFETREMLVDMCSTHTVGDCAFFYNRRDHPVLTVDGTEPYFHLYDGFVPLKSHEHDTYAPVVGYSKNSHFADILIPTYADWADITKKIYPTGCGDSNVGAIDTRWVDKKNIAMFRGSATGCGTTEDNNQRVRLAVLSARMNEGVGEDGRIIDAGLVKISSERNKKFEGERYVSYLRGTDKNGKKIKLVKRIPMNEQSTYKYIIHVDGHVSAYRLGKELSLGSCILKVDSLYDYQLWFSDKLIAYDPDADNRRAAHFVRIDKNLSNLKETIEWCIENDDICEQIAKNAMALYKQIMTKEYATNFCADIVNTISEQYKPIVVKQLAPPPNRLKLKKTIRAPIKN